MTEPKEPDLPMVRVDNPFPLLDKMIEKGSTPEALGKMMDLAERWKEARAREEFSTAMRDCQEAMPVVVKDAMNKHTSSRYARLEEVNKTIKPCYTSHGFSVSFGESDCPTPGMVRVTADVRHSGGHSAPYRLDVPLDGIGSQGKANAMNAVQAKGSTVAYGRRYLICMIFNVTIADEDTDGNADNGVIDEKQLLVINELLDDCNQEGSPVDSKRFLAFALGGAEGTLGDLPQSEFARVVDFLTRKIRKIRTEKAKKGDAAE